MILSDSSIRKRLQMQSLKIDPPPSDRCVQPASIDLHLSNEILKVSQNHWILRPDEDVWYIKKKMNFDDPRGFALESHQFVLGATREWIEIPDDLTGRIEGRLSIGRLGLTVHVTAGFIDPGFRGHITLELSNLNSLPILLSPGMPIAQICFYVVHGHVERPYGTDGIGSRYQGSEGVVGAKPPCLTG